MASKTKAPTVAQLRREMLYTKRAFKAMLEAKREGNFEFAAEIANELSGIWGGIGSDFEEAGE
jgi:hypothetical protein